jgi:hypothetical protein
LVPKVEERSDDMDMTGAEDDAAVDVSRVLEISFLMLCFQKEFRAWNVKVQVVTAEDVGKYTLDDVVLPLPGHAVTYPTHLVGVKYRYERPKPLSRSLHLFMEISQRIPGERRAQHRQHEAQAQVRVSTSVFSRALSSHNPIILFCCGFGGNFFSKFL